MREGCLLQANPFCWHCNGFLASEILVLYFPLEVFLFHTDLLGRGVCLCVPILGPTGCIQLCGGVNADVGSAPVASNNVCETWLAIHHQQFQLHFCGFFYWNPAPLWVPSVRVVRDDCILTILALWRSKLPSPLKGLRVVGRFVKDVLRKKWNEMAYKTSINSEILWILHPLTMNFHHFNRWFFIGWVARKESTGEFDDFSLQIVCPPSLLQKQFRKTMHA